ncbi:MAG: hypothetical protein NC911_09670 [Candidatus Omnitrophica bacterium]|nr:hypothetical protein [Candidatus Omnitrophota bacterium]
MKKMLVCFLVLPMALLAKTPYQFLQEAKKPEFRKGHTLLPLSRWGWELANDVRIELARNWGYGLELNERIDPEICQIASKEGLPIAIIIPRPLHRLGKGFLDGLADQAFCRDENGQVVKNVFSPEAPEIIFQKTGEFTVDFLNKLAEKAGKENIKIILNGGEYGLGVYGFGSKYWQKDPAILKAKGEKSWFDYISEKKASQERIIYQTVKKNFPAAAYIYYHTEGTHTNRYAGWWQWSYDYRQMRTISDYPATSIYYGHFTSDFDPKGAYGDMLTQALNSVAQQLQFGDNLSYNWLNAGWEGNKKLANLSLYMGYLKCYYTAGMIGGVAGYFSLPEKGGFKGDQGEEIPHWLAQMMVLSYVHGLFSHLEDYLRDGILLPGPEKHRWSRNLPAYEFPTGDPYLRVLVRKHNQGQKWLATAWAMDGKERLAAVEIPEIGRVELLARGCGSVYLVAKKNDKLEKKQVDENVVYPSQ